MLAIALFLTRRYELGTVVEDHSDTGGVVQVSVPPALRCLYQSGLALRRETACQQWHARAPSAAAIKDHDLG